MTSPHPRFLNESEFNCNILDYYITDHAHGVDAVHDGVTHSFKKYIALLLRSTSNSSPDKKVG